MSFARPVAAAALLGVAAAWSLAAGAQQIYRHVGPDGRITFSDRPPAEGRASPAPTVPLGGPRPAGAGEQVAALPFELRTASTRFPVTLYTRPGCRPCDSGRSYLTTRGIPFTEKTVTSQEDIDALQRLAGTPTLPFATIGGQQLKGFSEVEWAQFLDAAGYPKTSQLPSTYRRPPATPLVAAAAAETQQPAAAAQPPVEVPIPVAPPAPARSQDNPTGIQF